MEKYLIGILQSDPKLMVDGQVTSSNGFSYNLLNFSEEYVSLKFIANALSKLARYNGQNMDSDGYSVAQHAVMMAESALIAYGDPQLAMDCLHHDDGEAYMGDIVRPIKHIFADKGLSEFESNLETVIFKVLGVRFPFDKRVKEMDINICNYELSTLLNNNSTYDKNFDSNWDIWCSDKANKMFLKTHDKIQTLLSYKKEYDERN